jgi:hypothetical protein
MTWVKQEFCRHGHPMSENRYAWVDKAGRKRTRCRTCASAARTAYDRKDPEASRARWRDAARKRRDRLTDAERVAMVAASRAYYAEHREELRAAAIRRYAENREAIKDRRAKQRERDPEKARANDRAYRRGNLERARERDRRSADRHREARRERNRQWQVENPVASSTRPAATPG